MMTYFRKLARIVLLCLFALVFFFQSTLMAAGRHKKSAVSIPPAESSKLVKIPESGTPESQKTPEEEIYERRSDAAANEAAEALARQFKAKS